MIPVGISFAFVLLVWVVLGHRERMNAKPTQLRELVGHELRLALAGYPKAVDHSAELQMLTKRIGTIESTAGLKRLSG